MTHQHAPEVEFLWVPHSRQLLALADGWQPGNGVMQDAHHHEYATLMWRTPKPLTPAQDIIRAVAGVTGVSEREITGKSQEHRLARARYLAAYLMRERLGLSHTGIGRRLNRERKTATYALKRAEGLLLTDAAFMADYAAVVGAMDG